MEIRRYTKHLDVLDNMKRYPKDIFYVGNIELLDRPKVSIVGSRRPFGYVKEFTQKIANNLAKRGVTTVSGGAMGVDAIHITMDRWSSINHNISKCKWTRYNLIQQVNSKSYRKIYIKMV